jgi:hypothetical protein
MDLQAIHDLAVEAAREAGAAIRAFYKDSYTIRDKGEDPLRTRIWQPMPFWKTAFGALFLRLAGFQKNR